ncbi:IgGFc-binding protein [Sorangium cellulosum]|uniref:IgGFc-binding protein n=1 Tax=Sorangium cellulosum TaxID=56 RepID=UPI001F361079|nr:IgGFc-binding protein [Sorangium cellulosum]
MAAAVVLASAAAGLALAPSCFDSGTRWGDAPEEPPPPPCVAGELRCGAELSRCEQTAAGLAWVTIDDCAARGLVCASVELGCTACMPGVPSCKGQDVVACAPDGSLGDVVDTCDTSEGAACRGGSCLRLCAVAEVERSNVGCEYWAVDLDNARIDATSNAAAQQFAVVVSNPQPDVPNEVHIFQDDGAPGDPPAPMEIASALIAPLNLQVFKLGPREVDGSPDGEYNTGTHTALTRHAYKITSKFPVVAYQFNPLENVNVFSNDASLLKPREALTYNAGTMATAYVVAGWPQTIASTDDPDTNFDPANPTDLRAFLTIVGTREDTTVQVKTTARIVGGGPVPETAASGEIEVKLGAFDVLNLETGGFNADFTGSIVRADQPIAVFTGGEASDAPHFPRLADRRCCADHLEDQLDPIRATGKRFAVPHTPNRSQTVKQAGAQIEVVPEPEFVRIMAASTRGAEVRTTLPPPNDRITLSSMGQFHEVMVWGDFLIDSSEPVVVSQVMASQNATGVRQGLPGGDPSLIILPPIEQFRPDYVFLTPDKYAFDFISVIAPPSAVVRLDDVALSPEECEIAPADGLTDEQRGGGEPALVVYRCQLSFATIDPEKPAPDNVLPGRQRDGVHRIAASTPVGLLVTGFDSFVSYAYAGGSELREIAAPD